MGLLKRLEIDVFIFIDYCGILESVEYARSVVRYKLSGNKPLEIYPLRQNTPGKIPPKIKFLNPNLIKFGK